MAGPDRTPSHLVTLCRALEQEPYKFDFFQALRLLECAHPDKPRVGESVRAVDDPVRLGQEPSLAFAPSTLHSFRPGKEGRPWRLNVNFFGLFGPNGPLPLHLTEYARDRIRNSHDVTFARFLDIFHHRLLSLFYRAWADAQPTVQFDRPRSDRFSVYVGSLFGIGMPSLRDRDVVPDVAKLHYAGRLVCQTRNPEGLQAILADFFKLPVNIEEFIGQWTELPEDCRCRLGESQNTATLGVSATVGSHVWDCQQKFRITMGPMSLNDYQRLLPGGESLERLVALVRNYIGDELMWDLNLILKQEETPPLRLAETGQLGLSDWLDHHGVQQDPDDLSLSPLWEAVG